MEHNQGEETFRYVYSAKQQEELRRIRQKYAPPEEDKMEQLRRLDAGATRKANTISIATGVFGALLLGFGMSLTMTELGTVFHLGQNAGMLAGILIGIAGMAFIALAYPLYQKTLKKERERIAPEILRLTDELMK